jgi:thiosulfate/3-mercaptopyruvate sulfurtransferase
MIVAEPVRLGRVVHGTGDGVDSLVSTEWLERELGAPDLKLIDATAFLPGTGRDARAEFEQEHIPGAVHLDLDGGQRFRQPVPAHAAFRSQILEPDAVIGRARRQSLRRLRQQPDPHLGADLVDAQELRRPLCRPARRRLAEVEGGRTPGLARPRAASPRSFHRFARPGAAVDKHFVRSLVGAGTHELVDARLPRVSPAPIPEPRPGLASGHIPGARSLPQGQLFNPDNSWKRGDALRAEFDAAGIDLARPMVTSCGSGVTAAVLLFGAHLLGKDDVRIYDGSWTEWGADPETPKETGLPAKVDTGFANREPASK